MSEISLPLIAFCSAGIAVFVGTVVYLLLKKD